MKIHATLILVTALYGVFGTNLVPWVPRLSQLIAIAK